MTKETVSTAKSSSQAVQSPGGNASSGIIMPPPNSPDPMETTTHEAETRKDRSDNKRNFDDTENDSQSNVESDTSKRARKSHKPKQSDKIHELEASNKQLSKLVQHLSDKIDSMQTTLNSQERTITDLGKKHSHLLVPPSDLIYLKYI